MCLYEKLNIVKIRRALEVGNAKVRYNRLFEGKEDYEEEDSNEEISEEERERVEMAAMLESDCHNYKERKLDIHFQNPKIIINTLL